MHDAAVFSLGVVLLVVAGYVAWTQYRFKVVKFVIVQSLERSRCLEREHETMAANLDRALTQIREQGRLIEAMSPPAIQREPNYPTPPYVGHGQ